MIWTPGIREKGNEDDESALIMNTPLSDES